MNGTKNERINCKIRIEQARPIFKSNDMKDYGTLFAHCPKCDTVLKNQGQEKCQNCGLELNWE